jgi:hypothetical protein
MRKQILTMVAVALVGLPVLAMAAQNFSGSWVRNNAKIDQVPNQMYWLTREPNSGGAGGGGRGGGRGAPPQVVKVRPW